MKEERKRQKTTNGKGNLSRSKEDLGFGQLITEVRGLIQSARYAVATTVNTLQVLTNFEIGRRIVEHEQHGKDRAEYGELLMRTLAERLIEEFGRGFSKRNLDYMRRFYLDYADRLSQIVQKPSAQFVAKAIQQKPSGKLAISEKASRKSPFTLSKWIETQNIASLQRQQ